MYVLFYLVFIAEDVRKDLKSVFTHNLSEMEHAAAAVCVFDVLAL